MLLCGSLVLVKTVPSANQDQGLWGDRGPTRCCSDCGEDQPVRPDSGEKTLPSASGWFQSAAELRSAALQVSVVQMQREPFSVISSRHHRTRSLRFTSENNRDDISMTSLAWKPRNQLRAAEDRQTGNVTLSLNPEEDWTWTWTWICMWF